MPRSAVDLAREAAAAHGVAEPGTSRPRQPPTDGGQPVTSAAALGAVIRAERKARRLSQQAFADLAGVGRRFLSELENGKPTLEIGRVLQVLAAAGIDLSLRTRR